MLYLMVIWRKVTEVVVHIQGILELYPRVRFPEPPDSAFSYSEFPLPRILDRWLRGSFESKALPVSPILRELQFESPIRITHLIGSCHFVGRPDYAAAASESSQQYDRQNQLP